MIRTVDKKFLGMNSPSLYKEKDRCTYTPVDPAGEKHPMKKQEEEGGPSLEEAPPADTSRVN